MNNWQEVMMMVVMTEVDTMINKLEENLLTLSILVSINFLYHKLFYIWSKIKSAHFL